MTRSAQLTTADAADWIGAADGSGEPLVVDVRTPAEYASAHIRGAVNVPLDVVESDPARVASLFDGEVLLVCRTDRRASQAVRLLGPTLGARGHVLMGGMTRWQADGRHVEQGPAGPWAMDRQVRTVAGALVLTGVLASTVLPRAKWLAGGVGAGLLWSGVSDTCAMATMLGKLPYNRRGEAPSVDSVARELAAR